MEVGRMMDKHDVKFNGKEYLEYVKYKDSRKKPLSERDKGLIALTIMGIAFIVGIISIIQMFTASPSTFEYSWEGIAMFLAICAGLGWVMHGTGFLLVRG